MYVWTLCLQEPKLSAPRMNIKSKYARLMCSELTFKLPSMYQKSVFSSSYLQGSSNEVCVYMWRVDVLHTCTELLNLDLSLSSSFHLGMCLGSLAWPCNHVRTIDR